MDGMLRRKLELVCFTLVARTRELELGNAPRESEANSSETYSERRFEPEGTMEGMTIISVISRLPHATN